MSFCGTISVAVADADSSWSKQNHVMGTSDGFGNTSVSSANDPAGTLTTGSALSGTYYVDLYSNGYSSADSDY